MTFKLSLLLALTFAFGAGRSLFAEGPVTKTVEAKPVQTEGKSKTAEKANSESKPAAKPEVVEPIHLEVVTAPFRALMDAVATTKAQRRGLRAQNGQVAVQLAAQNEALVQQYLQQLRPVMNSELGFLRLICGDLTPEQRKPIKASALAGLKEAAKVMADQQNGQRVRVVAGNRTTSSNEPRAIISETIIKGLKETLTAEQIARYMDEAIKRTEKRKQTAIQFIVARLDNHLFLAPEQRDKIAGSISAKWQPRWERWTQIPQMHGENYFPNIPQNLVEPHLNTEQKQVWRGIQKNDDVWWNNGQGQGPNNDGWWGPDGENDAKADPENEVEAAAPAAGVQFFGGLLELLQ